MSAETELWRAADAVLDRLLDLAPGERAAALAAMSLPAGVRAAVARLLAAHVEGTGLLDRAVPGDAGAGLRGRRLGRWELEREIGRGGMSVVYRAHAADAQDQVAAVKLLTLGAWAARGVERFQQEQTVLARLRRKIRGFQADIVHGFLYDADIYVRLAAIGTGAVVLNSERSDNYTLSAIQRLAHFATLPLVDGVVANSSSGSRFAQRYLRYAKEKMHVVWNGLRVEELQKKAVELINGASNITQFMDRDTRPDFASTVMIPSIQDFIKNPNDVSGLLKKIEDQKKTIFTS